MNIKDYRLYLEEVVQVMDETREDELKLRAKEMTALVRDRVQNDKIQADGSEFGQYSDTPVPYWFFEDKGRVSNAETKALEKHGYFVSYAEFREVNNLQSEQIDLTFTGAMWSSAGLQEIEQLEGVSIAIISFKGEENKLKAGYHGERFGNILTPSEEEKNAVFEGYQERRVELLLELLG